MIKVTAYVFLSAAILVSTTNTFAQSQSDPPKPKAVATPTPKISDVLAKNAENIPDRNSIPRERREQAYAKLLEGQRYYWGMVRLRSQMGSATGARLARQALQKAVELDPTLAEGYTALAEIALSVPPNDLEEALALASIAVKIDKNNFGGNRILARLYTIKSRLNDGALDPVYVAKAIAAWKELARLDPRNAEAWAFLGEFYRRTAKNDERIDALQKWLASAAPVETRFYRTVMGNQEDLAPESASVKLGEAFLDAGRVPEAVEVLNTAVADDPGNGEALSLLREALEIADAKTSASAIQALQQAVFANPENASLVVLLVQTEARAGNSEAALKRLESTIARVAESDKMAAVTMRIAQGDLLLEAERLDDAAAAYRAALTLRGIDNSAVATDDERDLVILVTEKILRVYKLANRFNEAKATIDTAAVLLGRQDSFVDRQLISLYRENGRKNEALQAVRAARLRFPDDNSLLRLEASILTDSGKVDEGVRLVRAQIGRKSTIPLAAYDDFSNYLFISMLYSDARRGKEAIEAAKQALAVAEGEERRQIAELSLATALQMSGDYRTAEATLRSILAKSPGNPVALNNLGYFLVERGEKLEEALKLIQQAIKVDPNNPSYLDSLGWAYYKLDRLDAAEEALKKALRIDPSSATILEHLGDVYQKQGKAELARTAWQKAISLSSDEQQITNLKLKISKKTAT